ncbi:unnamed protein product [Withania somnifera]
MPPPAVAEKKDPGGIGFLDEVGGSVDGLMSCTESLGLESSDERAVDDPIEDLGNRDGLGLFSRRSNYGNNMEKKEKKKFPPPLSSLSQDGKPNFFLRAVRKDGRLELKEVKMDRPETLRASRQDGRLRLHLICDLQEEEEEWENEDFPVESEEHVEDEDELIETDEEIIDEEEEKMEEWKFPVTGSGSAEGYRRCYGGHGPNQQHHDLHVWQRCVTTR